MCSFMPPPGELAVMKLNTTRIEMRTICILVMLFNISTVLLSQSTSESADSRPLNSIYLNLLGDASLISVNYERQFLVRPNLLISSKLGLGFNNEFQLCLFGGCPPPEKYVTIPHNITGNLGKGRHFLEFGIGGTIISGNTRKPYILYPIVGYRFLPLKSKKLIFRVFGQFPFTGDDDIDIFFIPLGVSFGISF